ncbi:MAG: DUF1320 family protein [Candidatus Kapabacteria bacterium]|nr:DUF1320 family protein [Ignavibacteriota bacterium]MCW5886360.1 DUF1320 family protein [Candidatus Kapabacteria bacterium]
MSTINYQYIADRIPIEILKPLMSSAGLSDVNEDLVNEFISDADAEVDNALATRYLFPYIKTDEELGDKAFSLIKRWKFLIVRQLIYSRRYDDDEMKEVNSHHSAVLSILERVRKGNYEIPGLTRKTNNPSKLIKSKENTQVFNKRRLKTYDS